MKSFNKSSADMYPTKQKYIFDAKTIHKSRAITQLKIYENLMQLSKLES